MSFRLYPMAVDLSLIRGLVGSRKRAVLAELKRHNAGGFEWIDRQTASEPGQPPLEEVFKHLLAGRPLDPAWGTQFYAALEMLCARYGRRLMCELGRPEWIHRLAEAIRAAGVPAERFGLERHLIERGPPIPFEGDMDNSVGFLERAEVRAALRAFRRADFSALAADLRVGAAEVHSWLAYCDTAGCDLVAFHYL